MENKVTIKKNWYTSKVLWVNVVSVIAIIAQELTGSEIINADAQGMILAGINIVLRFITKFPIV